MRKVTPTPSRMKIGEQVVTHQPAISFSISFQHPFSRAGGRTSNVRQKFHEFHLNILGLEKPQMVD